MKSLGNKMPPTQRNDLVVRIVDDEVVILDQVTGKVHQLNATASCVWESCDGSSLVDDISARVATKFGVTVDAVRADVVKTLDEFDRLGLLSVK